MSDKSNEQKLVDLCFELVLVSANTDAFRNASRDEQMEWVRRQLEVMGFKTVPVGMSWGVLVDE